MRFPRFHYGIAIALGLSMLCMSQVPVFADGLQSPALSSSINGSTISLSWNVPGGTATFMLRRDTAAAPANSSAGTLVLTTADNTTTTYQDTNLPNGTYYYSVFAINGGLTSAPGSAGPLRVDVGGGGNASWLIQLRQQNGLDAAGNPLPAASSSVSSSTSSSSSEPAMDVKPSAPVESASSPSSSSSSSSSSSTAPESQLQIRTCERVAKWLKGNSSARERLNARLMKHFGFVCAG